MFAGVLNGGLLSSQVDGCSFLGGMVACWAVRWKVAVIWGAMVACWAVRWMVALVWGAMVACSVVRWMVAFVWGGNGGLLSCQVDGCSLHCMAKQREARNTHINIHTGAWTKSPPPSRRDFVHGFVSGWDFVLHSHACTNTLTYIYSLHYLSYPPPTATVQCLL